MSENNVKGEEGRPPEEMECNGNDAICTAVLRNGKPCSFRAKQQHPDRGWLCQLHMRCALHQLQCAICLSDAKPCTAVELQCGHQFHKTCLLRWLRRRHLTCPLCRKVNIGAMVMLNICPLTARLRMLFEFMPCPEGVTFPTYMTALMGSPEVVDALQISEARCKWLRAVTYQFPTPSLFLQFVEYSDAF